jgi:hypothetical protein
MEPSTLSTASSSEDRAKLTIPPPGAVNRHHADIIATAEGHAFDAFAIFSHQIPAVAVTADAGATKADVLTDAAGTSFG